ncbi:hypothetical protein MJL22_25835, partial [Salmonella enterica subsp. enterica serovar Montevideo]|nr:hypothetical protein [Salmonella enterica subsp. enterica serovar Montevideo]
RQILGRLREGNSAGKETSAKSEEKASTPAQRQQASLEEQNNDGSCRSSAGRRASSVNLVRVLRGLAASLKRALWRWALWGWRWSV